MKKVLFLFAFLLLGIGAMAQKVIYDETNQTGVRTVVCEGMNLGAVSYTHLDVYKRQVSHRSDASSCWLQRK